MGFSISWIALPMSKDEALAHAGFRDTGMLDEANEAPFSAAQLPGGWSVIFSNDLLFAAPERLDALSKGTRLIACLIEEHAMFAVCVCRADGAASWSVCHDAQQGAYHIETSGDVPQQFDAIVAKLRAEQDAAGREGAGVDYLFDVPVELAAEITGYRHDDWNEVQFTAIEPAA